MKWSRYKELRKLAALVKAWLTEEKMSVNINNVIHALEALGYLSSHPTIREAPETYDEFLNFYRSERATAKEHIERLKDWVDSLESAYDAMLSAKPPRR